MKKHLTKAKLIKYAIHIVVLIFSYLIPKYISDQTLLSVAIPLVIFVLMLFFYNEIKKYVLLVIENIWKLALSLIRIIRSYKKISVTFILIISVAVIYLCFMTSTNIEKSSIKYPYAELVTDSLNECKYIEIEPNLRSVFNYLSKKQAPNQNYKSTTIILDKYLKTIIYPDLSKKYKIEFGGTTESGQSKILGVDEISYKLILQILNDLKSHGKENDFNSYVINSSKYFKTNRISNKLKFDLIIEEGKILKNLYSGQFLPTFVPKQDLIKFYSSRVNYIRDFISLPDTTFMIPGYKKHNLYAIQKIYSLFTKYLINVFIYHKEYENIHKYLEYALSNTSDKKLITFLLLRVTNINNMFNIKSKYEIISLIDKYKKSIQKDAIEDLKTALTMSTNDFDLENMTFELFDYDLSKVDFNKIKTEISFVVPSSMSTNFWEVENNKNKFGLKIQFKKLFTLFDDPTFNFFNELDFSINGLPLQSFATSFGNENNATVIKFVINTFFHPDFKVKNGILTIDKNEFEKSNDRLKKVCKKFIVNALKGLNSSKPELLPLVFEKDSINDNIIQNLFINYTNKKDSSVYHKIYPITSIQNYLKFRERNLQLRSIDFDKMKYDSTVTNLFGAEFEYDNEIDKLDDIITEKTIDSKKTFIEFLESAIILSLKTPIELRNFKKEFWKDKMNSYPRYPHDYNILISTILEPVLRRKNIRISWEDTTNLNVARCYTDDKKYETNIYLFNAHNDILLNSIARDSLISIYSNDISDGIYLIFWFKNDHFPLPTSIKTIRDFKNIISRIEVPNNFKITVFNCSPNLEKKKITKK